MRADPPPIVALNRAIAVAMRDGADKGLELVDEPLAGSELANYHLSHAAQTDLCRRLGQMVDACVAYELALTKQEPKRRFQERRLSELKDSDGRGMHNTTHFGVFC